MREIIVVLLPSSKVKRSKTIFYYFSKKVNPHGPTPTLYLFVNLPFAEYSLHSHQWYNLAILQPYCKN